MEGPGAFVPHAGAHHGDGTPHASVRTYVTGFVLSVLLTAVPFGLVMSGALPSAAAVALAIGLGVAQIIVHLIYFLHMNGEASRSWTMAALVFTVIVVAILVVGSLWIMAHLDANMMPGVMPPE
jgi:cytochrome o ubiquinol oxidase subunit IV